MVLYQTWLMPGFRSCNDDTLIFMENNLEKALNMKLILYFFEQLSGLKINFHKSKIYCSVKPMNWKIVIRSYLGASPGIFLSSI
jgi:hypothetical protein